VQPQTLPLPQALIGNVPIEGMHEGIARRHRPVRSCRYPNRPQHLLPCQGLTTFLNLWHRDIQACRNRCR
jgi:hypothetical protein